MKPRLFSCVLLVSLTALGAQTTNHPFSVKDDISMSRFNDPSEEQEDFDANHVKYSPDGRHVAIVTTRGLLASDESETVLSVFDMDEVRRSLQQDGGNLPRRRVLVRVHARPQGNRMDASAPLIEDVRWSSDSQKLFLKVMNANGLMELETVSLRGTPPRRLTPLGYSVDRYDVQGDTIAYTATRGDKPVVPRGETINKDAIDETGVRLRDIVLPGLVSDNYPRDFVLGTARLSKPETSFHQIPGYAMRDIRVLLALYPFRLSPDKRFLITVKPVSDVPETWSRYEPEDGFEQYRFLPENPSSKRSDHSLRPRQYFLVDLKTGETKPLVRGPNARNLAYVSDLSLAAWAPDGKRVLVTNVFLPLDQSGLQSSVKPCRVATVDLPSMHLRCLLETDPKSPYVDAHIVRAEFGGKSDEIFLNMKSGAIDQLHLSYRLASNLWEEQMTSASSSEDAQSQTSRGLQALQVSPLEVFVKQSLNVRPTLWARDQNTGSSRQIWDPNPQLADVIFGDASEFRWTDNSGTKWIGGLVKPTGYVPGKRYPLVIQMYVFHQQEFLTDGAEPTAFAARELASNGFVVLEVRKQPNAYSEEGAATHLRGYQSAVRALDAAGMIDPHEVGVVGYSMSCWYAEYALVHDPNLFAVATIADGIDYSYMQYMLFGPGPPFLSAQYKREHGGAFFTEAKTRWFDEAIGFHLDRAIAPIRIETINPESVLQEWELYSSLYMQQKPVDLIYFPEGTHIHERPSERYESQQGNVDWMRFWLQGYEDPDRSKSAQYKRWEALRTESNDVTGAGRWVRPVSNPSP